MAVFPEQMDKLDLNDPVGSLRRVENYIRYMAERMEFANSRTTRTVTEAGVSTVGVYQAVVNLADTVAVLQASLTAMNGKLTGQIQTIDTALEALKGQAAALEARVAALEQPEAG